MFPLMKIDITNFANDFLCLRGIDKKWTCHTIGQKLSYPMTTSLAPANIVLNLVRDGNLFYS